MPKYAIKINKNNTHTHSDRATQKLAQHSARCYATDRERERDRESTEVERSAVAAAAAEGKFSVPPKRHEILCVLCLYMYVRVYACVCVRVN